LVAQIEDYFNRILSYLKISTPVGNPTNLKLTVDVFNPEKISACAWRVTKDPAAYEIKMNAGLTYCLWTASRTFEIPEYNILPWIEECAINDERLRKLSKKTCFEAGQKFLVIDSFDPLTVMLNAQNLSFVDDVVRETNIRHYQHRIEVIDRK
jgi:hypothetical protein